VSAARIRALETQAASTRYDASLAAQTVAEYEKAWRYLRALRRWFVILGLVGFVASVPLVDLSHRPRLGFLGVLPMLWMVTMLFIVAQWNLFRCPRCGKAFHIRFPRGNGFIRRCHHCGIRIGDVPAELEPDASG